MRRRREVRSWHQSPPLVLWPSGILRSQVTMGVARAGRGRDNMREAPEGRVTELLVNWASGDQDALNQLIPLVYGPLRRLAERQLRSERSNHPLQPTALVTEAHMRPTNPRAGTCQ